MVIARHRSGEEASGEVGGMREIGEKLRVAGHRKRAEGEK